MKEQSRITHNLGQFSGWKLCCFPGRRYSNAEIDNLRNGIFGMCIKGSVFSRVPGEFHSKEKQKLMMLMLKLELREISAVLT